MPLTAGHMLNHPTPHGWGAFDGAALQPDAHNKDVGVILKQGDSTLVYLHLNIFIRDCRLIIPIPLFYRMGLTTESRQNHGAITNHNEASPQRSVALEDDGLVERRIE